MPEETELTESVQADTLESSTEEVVAEPAGETYTIKVDGEEQQVTLDELRDGYSRQADYTRKTQELVSERQRLQQYEAIGKALEADPAATLEALSTAFGVEDNFNTRTTTNTEESWEMKDPHDERLAKLETQIEQQAKLQRQQDLEREISGLKERFGEFDEQELFSHALKEQIPNLEAAFTHMRFSEVADKAQRLEEEQERVQSKREASVVEGGATKQAGSVVRGGVGQTPSSIRDAFLQAKEQLGS